MTNWKPSEQVKPWDSSARDRHTVPQAVSCYTKSLGTTKVLWSATPDGRRAPALQVRYLLREQMILVAHTIA